MKFKNLSSPLIVGNTILKNRFFFPNALPKTQQGPETFPADPIISFYAELAKNGCALIAYADMSSSDQRNAFNNDEMHFPMYDLSDPSVENYISQLADVVHYYGSKLTLDIFVGNKMRDLDVVESAPVELDPELLKKDIHVAEINNGKTRITEEHMELITNMVIEKALYHKQLGFDSGYIGPFYGILGSFLSPSKNTRGDDYSGSFENRARFPLQLIKRVREAVGDDFMLIFDVNRLERDLSFDEVIDFVRLAEPYVDMILMRPAQIQTPFETDLEGSLKPKSLEMSHQFKLAGINKPIISWTGFMRFEQMEEAIASGMCDMIMAGRFVLSNPNMGELLKEGRSDDLVPCLLCNKCHGDTLSGPWIALCSVNPQIGLASRLDRMVTAPQCRKKVAVIGGGPAGMAAALRCRERGHEVVLYEATDRLGGQTKTSDYPDFKWALKRWLEHMESAVFRSGADVRLKIKATPEALSGEGFDVVIAAIGAVPVLPNVNGAHSDGVITPYEVYGNEQTLGRKVVCIGGSETSVETALYLARQGHDVTLLCRKRHIAYDANPIHYVDTLRGSVLKQENLNTVTKAVATLITSTSVVYLSDDGLEHTIECDSVVAAGGMMPLQQEAVSFAGIADEFFSIGDCHAVGNIQKCMRMAFAAANQI